ncbi:hypothetical protein B0H13DRAFT_2325606 [Mycena leptocephala]|nr:hypothetical protein B0H13DRAFT_2325606 [Mycena leptocephala]
MRVKPASRTGAKNPASKADAAAPASAAAAVGETIARSPRRAAAAAAPLPSCPCTTLFALFPSSQPPLRLPSPSLHRAQDAAAPLVVAKFGSKNGSNLNRTELNAAFRFSVRQG